MIYPSIHVAFCGDAGYAEHTAVAMASVCHNSRAPNALVFWVLTSGLSPTAEELLQQVAIRAGARMSIVRIDSSRFAEAPVLEHFTSGMYFRLLIPEMLPDDAKRCVYLDGDLVVEADIAELFATDLAGKPLGAVINPGFARHASLGMPTHARYFNTGVLVMDLDMWRREQIAMRTSEFIREHPAKLISPDQDALNAVLVDRWQELDLRWNQQRSFWETLKMEAGYTADQVAMSQAAPWIVHYSSSSKPWQFSNDHPFRRRYHHYRRLAGLPPVSRRPKTFRELLVRLGKFVVPHRYRRLLKRLPS